jgi:hypothetical protein
MPTQRSDCGTFAVFKPMPTGMGPGDTPSPCNSVAKTLRPLLVGGQPFEAALELTDRSSATPMAGTHLFTISRVLTRWLHLGYMSKSRRRLLMRDRAKLPYATLYTGGSDGFVVSTAAPIAGWNDPVPGRVFHPAVVQRLSRRTAKSCSNSTAA